ncbi:unnamed protein product [Mytilus coruscus]|uniref:EGF-like domain-containing protein n=1 Tax=Mytilus coruscus TaxID=42192 RepID=A0A6J8D630_MYTCO|nr:unnamed protein product [Mytilus coruscus]
MNDIIGPIGYGAARFIQKDSTLSITIRFENDHNASAPAQKVFVVHTFDKSIDMRTFKLGKFGFGNFNHDLKERTQFQVSVNLTEIYEGLFVRVRGGLDIMKKRVTWEFQTVETSTGLAPSDPRKGFLPPNNGTSGQGYVTFSVKPKTDVKTMARIDLKGSIYFDQNEPIDTPLIFNTIDDTPPDINCSVVQEMLSSEILAVSVSYHDIGSGYQSTDVLLISEYGYETLLTEITENVIQIPLPPGDEYQLVFSPVDFTDNRHGFENIKLKNSIHVYFPRIQGVCNDKNNCSGNGNCTSNNNCICDFGFYGDDCSKDSPPLEPPILDARDAEGFEDSDIAIYLSAKVTNVTSYDSFKIFIMNFPELSTFSSGHLVDYRWELNFSDFGNISFMPPRDVSGNFTFHVLAELVQGSRNSTRLGFISVVIKPIVDGVDLRVRVDCFSMKKSYANLHIRAPLKDADSSETLEVSVTVPENFNLSSGQEINTGTFELSSMDILNTIEVFGTNMSEIDPFNITIVSIVVENGTSLQKSYLDTVTVEKCTGKALEPPIIHAENIIGDEDSPILFYVSAEPSNKTEVQIDGIYIFLSRYPVNSSFSHGIPVGNLWKLQEAEFGQMFYIPPEDYSGTFNLHISAYILSEEENSTREASSHVQVNPVIDGMNITLSVGCYQENKPNIELNISTSLLDKDNSESATFYVTVPSGYTLIPGFNLFGNFYQVDISDINNMILKRKYVLSHITSPLEVEVTAVVKEREAKKQIKIKEKSVLHKCLGNLAISDDSVLIYVQPWVHYSMTPSGSLNPGKGSSSSTAKSAAVLTTQTATIAASTKDSMTSSGSLNTGKGIASSKTYSASVSTTPTAAIVAFTKDSVTSTGSLSHGKGIASSKTNTADVLSTHTATIVPSTKGEEKQFTERINLRLNYEVTVDLTNTSTATYKKLFHDTFTGLFEYYSHSSIKNVFINITLHSIAKGSLIAIHDVITSTESKKDIKKILDPTKQKSLINIGNTAVQVLSFSVIDSTESDSSKLSILWTAVISASSAVFGLIVIVTTIFLIRKQMTKHKPKENIEIRGESQRLMEMTPVKIHRLMDMTPVQIPRPKLINEWSSYENKAAVYT